MITLLVTLAVALVVTLGVIRLSTRFAHHTHDAVGGTRRFHVRAVPRVGALGIVAGLMAGALLLHHQQPQAGAIALALLVSGVPVLAAGLLEDLTRRVSPRKRLLCAAISAAIAAIWLETHITRTGLVGLDWLVSFTAGSMVLTVFTVAGVANAMNIIDGFNGLASMCAMIMLIGLAYVASEAGDTTVMVLALAGIGALLGFFVWNFPAGLVFLGDGGAYFVGFYVAELSLLLLARNPEVSPLFPLLLCFYPVFETLFSIYRRRVLHVRAVGMPDGVHLHSLIYRRLVRWAAGKRTARELTRRNSMTSPYLWVLCMLSAVPAVLFWRHTWAMLLFIVLFGVTYLGLYWRIVRFRAPRLLRRLASRPAPLDAGDNPRT